MGAGLSRRVWGRIVAMFGFILALNVAGWGIYVLAVMPHHFNYRGEGGSPGLGVGPRGRDHRVVPRLPARLRRRPHLLHRQHHPQADGRR